MTTSIDNVVRIDHGNDFTLVDLEEFSSKLGALFYQAKFKLKSKDSLNSTNISILEEVLSYKGKLVEDKKPLYEKYFLSNKKLSESDPLYTWSIATSMVYEVSKKSL